MTSAYQVREIAELLGVSTATVYAELADTGEIAGVPALRIRSRWVLPKRPIDEKLGLSGPRPE